MGKVVIVHVGWGGADIGNLCTSPQFCCEPKTALKNSLLLKYACPHMINPLREWGMPSAPVSPSCPSPPTTRTCANKCLLNWIKLTGHLGGKERELDHNLDSETMGKLKDQWPLSSELNYLHKNKRLWYLAINLLTVVSASKVHRCPFQFLSHIVHRKWDSLIHRITVALVPSPFPTLHLQSPHTFFLFSICHD